MEIKTKFNLEDEVYFMHSNSIVKDKICIIDCKVQNWKNTEISIEYIFAYMSRTVVKEDKCFATKQELLDSL